MQIEQLVAKFESQDFQGGDFGHIEHLRIAWHYVCKESLVIAKEKFHSNVQALVTKLGAESKYHRSLTDFFLDYLFHVRLYLGSDSWELLQKKCLLMIEDAQALIKFYYSDEVIHSEAARQGYIAPDKMPLDRASLKLSLEETPVYELNEYDSPLIVSIPHNGQLIPHDVLQQMEPTALSSQDTDWYLSQLYDFLDELEVTSISANYSRYLIDLNRDSSGVELYKGADNTELCPTSRFDLELLYAKGNEPSAEEIDRRIKQYWQPYHQAIAEQIAKAKVKHGYAILFEVHSIAQEVPRFFDGKLPDFNFGTNDGATVSSELNMSLENFDTGGYSKVINARFKGGFITRHYAKPDDNIFTIQLELSQATYMNRAELSKELKQIKTDLKRLLSALIGIY